MIRLAVLLSFLLLGSASYAGKETNDMLLELSVAKKSLTVTDSQEILWNQVISETQQFPSKIQGTRAHLKKVITDALDDNTLMYVSIQNKILTDFYFSKKYEETMQAHYAMTAAWARFDRDLNELQKREFRSKMRSRISTTIKNTTDKVVKNVRIENFSSDEWNQKLGTTPEQREKIKILYDAELENLKNLANQINQYQIEINSMLDTPSQRMDILPETLKTVFVLQRDTHARLYVYYQNTYSILNTAQHQQITDVARSKLKILKFIL